MLHLQAWQSLASTSSGIDATDNLDHSLRPDGLDSAWWERFLDFRLRKIQSEGRLKDESNKLTLMRKELEASEAEDEQLGSAVADVMARYTAFRNRRKQLMYDVDMQLHLKLGQVSGSCSGGLVRSVQQQHTQMGRCWSGACPICLDGGFTPFCPTFV